MACCGWHAGPVARSWYAGWRENRAGEPVMRTEGPQVNGMRVEQLSMESPHLDMVWQLLRANTKTLGFFPRGALIQYTERGGILIAVLRDTCVGFVTFRPVRNSIRVVHLCIDEAHRNQGIARSLIEELSSRTKCYVGIGLKCRSDYGLDGFWSGLGFSRRSTGAGRGRKRMPLVFWWLDHGHPTLFDDLQEPGIRAVLDANIVLDLLETRNEESRALLDDWLDDVEYLYTDWLFHDLAAESRGEVQRQLKRQLKELDELKPLEVDSRKAGAIFEELSEQFGHRRQETWKRDLRQLSSAVAGRCSFFITRDEELLDKASEVRERHELSIVRPSDFIIEVDELQDKAKYQSERLGGTALRVRRVWKGEADALSGAFVSRGESKGALERRLHPYLARPRDCEVLTVSTPGASDPGGLVVYHRAHNGQLEIPVLRVLPRGQSYVLAVRMLSAALQRAADEGCFLVTVSESDAGSDVLQALTDLRFNYQDQVWFRYTVSCAASAPEVAALLRERASDFPRHRDLYEELADRVLAACSLGDSMALVGLEKTLWPAKVLDAPVPTFIVPIRPLWAAQLFEERMAGETLFGADQELMLRFENVYYRRKRPAAIRGPGRVLWYVTKDTRYTNTMALRACSYVDRVEIGPPGRCYDKFRHLGVFSREEVRELSRGEPVMAIKFSHTELFPHPVPRQAVLDVLRGDRGNAPPLRSPVSVSPDEFGRLYWLGKYGSLEGCPVAEGPSPGHSSQVH